MAENTKKPEKSKFSLANVYKTHMAEFKRIIWPSKKEVVRQTITVIFVSLIIGLIIWGLDIAFEEGYRALFSILGK